MSQKSMPQLVLSLFSGIGLLDEAFTRAGFCVVSAGDLMTGRDIRNFVSVKGKFEGVIGGSPCQDISGLKPKNKKTDYSLKMIEEYKRVVLESDTDWWLHENVKGVPDIIIDGYNHQKLIINQGWYEPVQRTRVIQFGCKFGKHITIERGKLLDNCVELALATDDRPFHELKTLQGLPDDFDLPYFTHSGKKTVVGNGVPLVMGEVIANAVKDVVTPKNSKKNPTFFRNKDYVTNRSLNSVTKEPCLCGCGQIPAGRKKYYHQNCRKQAQRKRDKKLGIDRA